MSQCFVQKNRRRRTASIAYSMHTHSLHYHLSQPCLTASYSHDACVTEHFTRVVLYSLDTSVNPKRRGLKGELRRVNIVSTRGVSSWS